MNHQLTPAQLGAIREKDKSKGPSLRPPKISLPKMPGMMHQLGPKPPKIAKRKFYGEI